MINKDNGLFQNFLLPLLLTILLIIGSLALDWVDLTNITWTALLFVIIGLAVFLAEIMAINISRNSERKNTFEFVTSLLLANRAAGGSNILTLDEVTAIEAASEEVWIYAYDLAWEGDNSVFPDLVSENLTRGVKYRYIVPNSNQVLIRVNSLLSKYKKIKNARKGIVFKCRPLELKLVQFGIAIYNPSITAEQGRQLSDCVVVFYPHYKSHAPRTEARFISMKGPSTIEVQEGFLEFWNDSMDISNAGRLHI